MVQQRGVYHPNPPEPSSRSSHAFLLIAMLVIATVPLITVAEPTPRYARTFATVIATDILHLRECPSLTCRVTGSAPLGTKLEITGEPVHGFVPVRDATRKGWVWHLYLNHQSDRWPLRQGVTGCDRVALIFNAGIGMEPSGTILDTLAETQVPVTVFAMGWWAERYPDYLQRLDRETRAVIGSHGNTQTFLTTASDTQVVAEIRDSAARIQDVLGYPAARYYTAYASDSDGQVELLIASEGYLPIGWTVSAADYRADDTAEAIRDRVLDGVEDGAIIELHLDGPATEQSTAVALPEIIKEIERHRYTLVTIPEIILPCPATP